MSKKTRYVRIKLDYVIDVGREVEVLPHEVMAFLNRVGGTHDLVCRGLKGVLRKPNQVRLLSPVHRAVSLWHPKEKPVEAEPSAPKPTVKKARARRARRSAA